jgi:CheY-like chemotaxis protein
VLAEKARRLGWEVSAEQLTDDQVLEILCESGVSTSTQTTEISGRGLGMDIVRDRIRELRGVLSMKSFDGQGSRFTIQVPTQVSTLRGISVLVGEYRFGIPQESVERILRLTPSEIRSINGKEVISWEEQTIAVLPLHHFVGATNGISKSQKPLRYMLLLGYGDHKMALEVDEILTEVPFYLRPLGKQFEHVDHLAGGALMSDGSVLPVLDISALFNKTRMGGASRIQHTELHTENGKQASSLDKSDKRQSRILVVDDSITMRTLEQNILSSNGYDVISAKHGREAQSLLKEYDDVGLVISDVEMPHVTGLELCKSIRAGDNPDLPVILVTSLGSEEEKKAGMQAGADAYIVKGDFRQEHFLDTVQRYI